MTVDSDRLQGSSRDPAPESEGVPSERAKSLSCKLSRSSNTVHDAFRSQGPRQVKFVPTTPTAVKLQVDYELRSETPAPSRRHGSDAPGVLLACSPSPMSPFPTGKRLSIPPTGGHWSQLPIARNVLGLVSAKPEQAGELLRSSVASLDPLASSTCKTSLNSRLVPLFKPKRRRLPEKLDRTDRAARSLPGEPAHEARNARAEIEGRNACTRS
jgi:hypothetical protein